MTSDARASFVGIEVLYTGTGEARVTSLALEVLYKPLTPVPYPTDHALPWTIEPDWANGVTERLLWKTDILTSQSGVEQRRKLRISPRRVISARFVLIGDERRLYDSIMVDGEGVFRYPLWWERYVLTENANAGDNVLFCPVGHSELAVGVTVMIRGDDPFIYEFAIVFSRTDTSITLSTTLARDWPQGARVYMTRRAIMTSTPQGTRHADDAYEVSIDFETVDPDGYVPIAPSENIGFPVMELTPNDVNDLTTTYERMLAEFDNQTGKRARVDTADRAFLIQQFEYMMVGRQELQAFRALLYWMAGKVNPFWVPTFFVDLVMKEGLRFLSSDTLIYVRRSGYTDSGGPAIPNRNIIGIYWRDGTHNLYTVASSALVNDTTESLTLTSAIGRNGSPRDVMRISFIKFMRQDQDEVEILHHTGRNGVATVKTTFRTMGATRSADDYTIIWTGDYNKEVHPDPVLPPLVPEDIPYVLVENPVLDWINQGDRDGPSAEPDGGDENSDPGDQGDGNDADTL